MSRSNTSSWFPLAKFVSDQLANENAKASCLDLQSKLSVCSISILMRM